MRPNKNIDAFFFLIKAGLFGRTEGMESLLPESVDWEEIYKLAKEQSVVGLVTEGIETLKEEWHKTHDSELVPRQFSLRFISYSLRMEKRNLAMNKFVASLIHRLQKRNINVLLVKGQSVAQCYTKPLLRTCGDVDLLLCDKAYQEAKDYLLPYASHSESEITHLHHLGLKIGDWLVELHGTLRCCLSFRIDKELDKIYHEAFYEGNVRSWTNRNVQIPLLGRENDVVYVFVHFLNHFYREGVGIRQICDWCRLLWTFRDSLDLGKLESRLKKMGVMSEWRAFGMYAVEYLGIPEEAMPFYDDNEKWRRKAWRIHLFIMKTGNMGYKRSNNTKINSYILRKTKSAWRRFCDQTNHLMIFPLDTLRFFPSILINGIRQK